MDEQAETLSRQAAEQARLSQETPVDFPTPLVGEGGDPNATHTFPQPPVAPTSPSGTPSPKGYQILGELGRGGMGVVYKARHVELERIVALKMILAGEFAEPRDRSRFRNEAQAAARLQHPNIVQVFEIGEHNHLPFFSLEYCSGGSLAQRLGDAPLPPLQAAQLVEILARALQAAHDKGIIHRDLKPANILLHLDNDDATAFFPFEAAIPKISDFGLAKDSALAKKADEEGHTRSGDILGTPSYMAPEQAAGKNKEITPAADIYALGAVLYKTLTGRPPFRTATPVETVYQVLQEEPLSPCRLHNKIPRDLETICLMCLRKDPKKRYASAKDLADDLRRFLNREPIRARPVGKMERALKWAARRPVVAGLLVAVVLLAALGVGGITLAYQNALSERDKARKSEDRAKEKEGLAKSAQEKTSKALKDVHDAQEKIRLALAEVQAVLVRETTAKRVAEEHLYRHTIGQAELESSLSNWGAAQGFLRLSPPHLHRWEWHWLNTLSGKQRRVLPGASRGAFAVAFSPAQRRIASVGLDGSLRIWDTDTGKEILLHQAHDGQAYSVSFHPTEPWVVTSGDDGTVKVWHTQTKALVSKFSLHQGQVWIARFHPNGKQVASAGRDGLIHLWESKTGTHVRVLKAHDDAVSGLAFSPVGPYLASAGVDRTIRIWDLTTGQEIIAFEGHAEQITSLAFHPKGRQLASATGDPNGKEPGGGKIKLWDIAGLLDTHAKKLLIKTGKQPPASTWQAHAQGITQLAYSPDGLSLASVSADTTAKVWDVATRQERFTLAGHKAIVWGLAFAPEGGQLATCGNDATVRLWNLAQGENPSAFRGHKGIIHALAVSRDGSLTISGNNDKSPPVKEPAGKGVAKIWNPKSLEVYAELPHPGAVWGVQLSTDKRLLATACGDGNVRLWDLENLRAPKLTRTLAKHPGPVRGVALSPDGSLLAAASKDIRLYDVRSGRRLHILTGHQADVTCVEFAPQGNLLASADALGVIKFWDPKAAKELKTLPARHSGTVYGLAFRGDAKVLASGGFDETIQLWDVAKGEVQQTLRGHSLWVTSVLFSPDGSRLFSASADKTVRVWDPLSGQRLLTLHGPTGEATCLALGADGSRLFCGSADMTVRIWHTEMEEKLKPNR